MRSIIGIGINQSNLCQLSAADLDRVCSDIAAFGFNSVRFAVDWGYLANFIGRVNYAPVRQVASTLAKHGLTALPVIGIHYPFVHSPAAFAEFTRTVVQIFGAVAAYEVWNEPNLWAFGIGGPAEFLTYLRAAAPIIRSVGAKVIHGGLAAYPDHRALWMRNYSPTTWLKELYNAGESGDYDLFGYHPYSITTAEKWVDPGTTPFGIAQITALDELRRVRGDVRPYAFTEIGYDTGKIDTGIAARYLAQQMPAMNERADAHWLFCWRDTPGDGGNYGLVTANNAPKTLIYNAAKQIL
ncbi:hypothetical protein [Mycolicibacterium sp. A43C]